MLLEKWNSIQEIIYSFVVLCLYIYSLYIYKECWFTTKIEKWINKLINVKKIQFVKVILNINIGCWYYYQINNNNLNNFKFFAFIDPFIWPNQYRFLFSQKYMLYIYLIIFKDNCINSNNFSAIDLIIYYRSIIDLKIKFKIQIFILHLLFQSNLQWISAAYLTSTGCRISTTTRWFDFIIMWSTI